MFGLSDSDFGSSSGGAGIMEFLMRGAALPAQNFFFFLLLLVSLLGLVDYFATKNKSLAGLSKKITPVQGIAGVVLAVYSLVTLVMSFTLMGKSFLVFLAFFLVSLSALAMSALLGVRFVNSFFSKNEKAKKGAAKVSQIGSDYLFPLCWINVSAGFFLLLTLGGIVLSLR